MESNDHGNNRPMTEAERAQAREEFFTLLKGAGDHIDLDGLTRACHEAKERGEVSADQLRGILLLNVSAFLKRIDSEFEAIQIPEWTWFFQALGRLNLDPRYFLTPEQINSLKELG